MHRLQAPIDPVLIFTPSPLSILSSPPPLRMVGGALTSDEAGRGMEALELYSKALSAIRSGLAILHSSVGVLPPSDSTLHDLRAKMEKYASICNGRIVRGIVRGIGNARFLTFQTEDSSCCLMNNDECYLCLSLNT